MRFSIAATCCLGIVLTGSLFGQEKPPVQPDVDGHLLVISPAPAPRPIFRNRLLPRSVDLVEGNAAPIYLRIRHELPEAAWRQIGDKAVNWLEIPLEEFPTIEARIFIGGWAGRLEQIEFGTRRKRCDWNYTIDEEKTNAVAILLPDAQAMRNWARLLALKARLEIAEHQYEEAAATIRTGLAFARHVAEGPFLVNVLVGNAISAMFIDRLEELVAAPDAPNTYWAITALPRPLISFRDALEVEQMFGQWMVPELTDKSTTSLLEWKVRYEKLNEQLINLHESRDLFALGEGGPPVAGFGDLNSRREELALRGRAYLRGLGSTAEQLQNVSDEEVIVRYISGRYAEVRDETFKLGYLTYAEVFTGQSKVEGVLAVAKNEPTMALLAQLAPALMGVKQAEARTERRLAALRLVEALRLHADEHEGRLPDKLADIDIVPVPIDPITQTPFEYERQDKSVVLRSPPEPETWKRRLQPVNYRITVRK